MRYALLYKRGGEWEKSVALWEKAAEHGDVAAFIELAKYYEHKVGDYEKALSVISVVMERVVVMEGSSYKTKLMIEEIHHRIKRLEGLTNETRNRVKRI